MGIIFCAPRWPLIPELIAVFNPREVSFQPADSRHSMKLLSEASQTLRSRLPAQTPREQRSIMIRLIVVLSGLVQR